MCFYTYYNQVYVNMCSRKHQPGSKKSWTDNITCDSLTTMGIKQSIEFSCLEQVQITVGEVNMNSNYGLQANIHKKCLNQQVI